MSRHVPDAGQSYRFVTAQTGRPVLDPDGPGRRLQLRSPGARRRLSARTVMRPAYLRALLGTVVATLFGVVGALASIITIYIAVHR